MAERRRLHRPIGALLVLVVLATAGSALLLVKSEEARDASAETLESLAETRAAIAMLETERQRLHDELESLSAVPPSLGLPSRSQALELGEKLATYAAEHQLLINSFESSESSASEGLLELPAVSYALEAQGSVGSLITMLELVGAYPMAPISELAFARAEESPDRWVMSVNLAVPYDAGEGE